MRNTLPLLLSLAIILAHPCAGPAAGRDESRYAFNEGFLVGNLPASAQSYADGNSLPAGIHRLEIRINGVLDDTSDIDIDPQGRVSCLPVDILQRLPLRPALREALDKAGGCADLSTQVEGARVTVDAATLQLRISVPQAALDAGPRGHVAPAQRDQGLTAGFIDYTFNHYAAAQRSAAYLGVAAGFNAGSWRLRHRFSLGRRRGRLDHQAYATTLQRDLADWNARLVMGQGATSSSLFPSVPFIGASVLTDEQMLPDSQRGYAPVVRGTAEGSALVTVRQNGQAIRELSVAPGPFIIDDLYPTAYSGDLQVTVMEADGREQRFDVSFSAAPLALRAGTSRVNVAAGQLDSLQTGYRDTPLRTGRRFVEATYARGLSNTVTALAGAQWAEHYHAASAGIALNTRIGAFGSDLTSSSARPPGVAARSGSSVRLNYQRYVAGTATRIGLSSSWTLARGFSGLADHLDPYSGGKETKAERSRLHWNINQRLGDHSQFYLMGSQSTSWRHAQGHLQYQMGWQQSLGSVNIDVSATRSDSGDRGQDVRYAIGMSMPLGRAMHAPRLITRLDRADTGSRQSLDVSGSLGASNPFSYGASASRGSHGDTSHLSGTWQSSHGRFHASAGHAEQGATRSLGAAGSLVLHAGGLNAGPASPGTLVLAHAAGAEGARVGLGGDIRIARNGYAVLPHASPYRWNRIELDPSGLPLDVSVVRTSQQVAPTAGSIAPVTFDVRRDSVLFIDAVDWLGRSLPFAAVIHDEQGRAVGAVGQGSVIQLRGAQARGVLTARVDGRALCRLVYELPATPDANGLKWIQSTCTHTGSMD